MHDDQVTRLDLTDTLVDKVLSNDTACLSIHALLGDKDVRVAVISKLRDAGVSAPGVVYRLLVLAFGGCERFLLGSIKSRLQAYISNTPVLNGILQKLLNLQHGAKAQAEFKSSVLASLKDGKPLKPDIIPDEGSSFEMIVALYTAKQIEELDDHIDKLGDEVIKSFRDDLANQFNQLVAPELGWHVEVMYPENLSAFDRLKYTAGLDDFRGREDEIEMLRRFAGDPTCGGRIFNFRWMLLTGDAGAGKTRLAYHFTREKLDNLWDKGKLDSNSLKAFAHNDNCTKWRPVKPTFIVIDYVQSLPKQVNALLLAFSRQAANYEFPVRLLLLERSSNAIWTDKLLPETSDKPVIEQHNFDRKGVLGTAIKPLSAEDIVILMQKRILKARFDVPEPSTLLSLAESVDARKTSVAGDGRTELVPTPRPLFAIATSEAIIDAMRNGRKLPEYFESEKVLKGIIQRDRITIWSEAIEEEGERWKYEMGLAVATLAQGVSLTDLNDDNFGEGTALLPQMPPDHNSDSLAAFGCRNDWWLPMEPDILGEYFVSEQLSNKFLMKAEIHRTALIEGSFLLREEQTIISFLRMAHDFPDRFKKLKLEEVARATKSEQTLLSLTRLVVYVTSYRIVFSVVSKIFGVVLGREDWNNSRKLRILIAKAAVNISCNAREAGDCYLVIEMLGRLDALRKAFPEDQEIALIDASAAFNISYIAGEADDWDCVAEMLDRIDALRRVFPENQKIALIDARATFSISNFAVAAGDLDCATEMLTRFNALTMNFGDIEFENSDGEVTTIRNLRDNLCTILNE